jgi:hypothetical protein
MDSPTRSLLLEGLPVLIADVTISQFRGVYDPRKWPAICRRRRGDVASNLLLEEFPFVY